MPTGSPIHQPWLSAMLQKYPGIPAREGKVECPNGIILTHL